MNRPDPKAEIEKLLEKREPFYKSRCDVRLSTDSSNVEEIVEKIIEAFDKVEHTV